MVELNAQLVKDTFESEFDDVKFRNFLSELSGKSINKKKNITNYIGKGYYDYIQSVHDCGYFKDIEHERIGFYIIELKKSSSISRARTMQRNVIAQVLRNSSNDCALAAFYEPNSPDWRFSFAYLEYELDEKGNIGEKLAPAKRHSFLVGPNEPNYTCKKQFFDLLSHGKILVKDIEDAFNVENVTQEFFNEYKNLFYDLVDSINEIIERDSAVRNEFETKHIKVSDFAKKLLGQIVFLYFVQKKGWLGVPEDGQWGEGPKNFMRRLFDKEYIEYDNGRFFDDVIEPLFYQGLSEGVSDYHLSQFNCKIPFLNGGLFENINNYDWKHTDLVIPDAVFAKIFAVFDKFNFTVKEDEPLDKEIAVDPEMLGKVFENLLEVDDRKSKGAFYTPRYIVHYICQQNLILYLERNTENIPYEDIVFFIEKGHMALDSIIKAQEEAKKYNGTVYTNINLPKSIQKNADLLERLLCDVKVVDPAVGSGAFPVGMMTEIVQAREVLNNFLNYDINLYDLKRETIENSLYGVDISNSAVDITKLRFWLSLIVDEESIENIRPLPNLDNHIMCGNSIVDGFKGVKLFDENLIKNKDAQTTLTMRGSEREFRQLEKLKHLFFNENNPNEKIKLKKQINDIKWKFIEEIFKESGHENEIIELRRYKDYQSRPFFIWELEFSEIFSKTNPGFDIVIGNPPYFNIETLGANSEQADYLKKYYDVYMDKSDILFYFIEKSIKLSKQSVGFIISNAFLYSAKAVYLRNYILDNAPIRSIINFENFKVFQAGISTCIIQLDKQQKDNVANVRVFPKSDYDINKLEELLHDESQIMTISFEKDMPFSLVSKEISNINSKIDNDFPKLGDLFLVGSGMQTGANKIFIFKEFPKEFPPNFIRKRISGVNIKPYYINHKNGYLLYFEDIEEYDKLPLVIREYLENNKEKLISRADKKRRKTSKWWNYTFPMHKELYHLPKIYTSYRNKTNEFALDENNEYIGLTNTAIIFGNNKNFNLKYVTCLLNSNVLEFRYKSLGKNTGNNTYEYVPNAISKIPIPILSLDKQKIFIDLYDKINHLNYKLYKSNSSSEKKLLKNEINNVNAQINQLVYALYNISEDEIKIIEENI